MSISGGVLLRLEQSIEVPEGRLHVAIGRHFGETHRKENLTEFGTNLKCWKVWLSFRVDQKKDEMSKAYLEKSEFILYAHKFRLKMFAKWAFQKH